MDGWKKILEEHEIAPSYINCDFKNHPAIEHRWNEILEYGKQPDGNIFMSGTCGNGKTMTAVAIFAVCTCFRGRGARFYNAETLYPMWLREARNGMPGDLARRLGESPLLILDDLGQGEISDTFKRWVYGIINKRCEWERPTIVTTNLKSVQFRDVFGEAIVSRLCSGKIWKFEGKDHRIG